jgi:uncharacterized membrane protein
MMPILHYNESWMVYNSFLAFLPVGFGFLVLLSKNPIMRIIWGILWLIFLPNTIYVFTDLVHLIEQWTMIQPMLRIFLLLQYVSLVIVGIITFFIGLYPFEKLIFDRKKYKQKKAILLVIFNFFIAFGMVLGRVERINSWQIFTSPLQVVTSAISVFTSLDLILLFTLFGLFCNFLYFLFRSRFLSYMNMHFTILD